MSGNKGEREPMGDNLKDRIRDDLNAARRERDKLRTTLLSTVLSEVRNREIELGRDLVDADVLEVLNRGMKRRHEAAEQMLAGGRPDLAAREEQEAALLAEYLPEPMSEEEVRQLVREAIAAGANNVGAVMGRIMPAIKGRYDGKAANLLVREELG
jgi:uncharacterized protein